MLVALPSFPSSLQLGLLLRPASVTFFLSAPPRFGLGHAFLTMVLLFFSDFCPIRRRRFCFCRNSANDSARTRALIPVSLQSASPRASFPPRSGFATCFFCGAETPLSIPALGFVSCRRLMLMRRFFHFPRLQIARINLRVSNYCSCGKIKLLAAVRFF